MASISNIFIDQGATFTTTVTVTDSNGGDANGDDAISAHVGAKYTIGQLSVVNTLNVNATHNNDC